MTNPIDLLTEAADDDWSNPVATAALAAQGLLSMVGDNWAATGPQAARMIRARRPDRPLFLAVTEGALVDDPIAAEAFLNKVLASLHDSTWTTILGQRLAQLSSLGIVSLGTSTLRVLESAAVESGTLGELFTDRRAIAKGLGFLDLPILVAPPEEAEALLLPAVAVHGSRVWTTPRMAELALQARAAEKEVILVAHPLAHLSQRNRLDYRPGSIFTDLRL